MRIRGLVAAVVLGSCLQVVSSPAEAAPVRGCGPEVISHRGNIASAPEATLRSYRRVLRAGVRVLEADVRFTSNGVPVLMHDSTVDRTTDGSGPIEAMPMWRVARLDAGAGARVPRLVGLVRLARRWDAALVLELKRVAPRRDARSLLNVIRENGRVRPTLVQSFHIENLDLVQQMAPHIQTGLVFAVPPPISEARRAGAVVLPRLDISTRTQLRRWHRAGLDVISWTANRRAAWRALEAARVDAVVTDAPRAYLTWVRRGCR